jgi:hypothetical protein
MRGKIVAYPWGKNKGLLRQLKFAATLTRPWYKRAILVEERKSMWGLSRLGYFVGLAAVVGVLAVSWLALVYLFPAPPWKITIATATGGSTYELLGNRYKAILARSHVDVSVLLTNGDCWRTRIPALRLASWPAAFPILRCRQIYVRWVGSTTNRFGFSTARWTYGLT